MRGKYTSVMPSDLTIGTSGGNKTAYALTVGTSGGNKTVFEGWVGTSGGNKQFFSASPIVSATPTDQSYDDTPSSLIFAPETASVLGGVGPFTYLWTYTGTSGGTFTFAGGIVTLSTCTPQVASVAPLATASASLICTVTDTTTGLTGVSNTVALEYNRI